MKKMSKYKVLETFTEKNHDGTVYLKGGTYPKGDYKTTEKRLEELTTNKNKYKRPFLAEVEAEKEVEKEAEKEEKPKSKGKAKTEAAKGKDHKKSEK